MALPAVKHLDPVVGVDVHAVIVAPEPAPIYLPHPHVGFVLDLREYIDAALGVIGSIVFTFVEEEAIDYLQDNPDVANELDHALKSAATDLQQADAELMRNPLIAEGVKFSKAAGSVAGDIASSAGDIANAAGAGVGMGSVAGRPIFINGFLRATAGTHSFHVPGLHFPLGESFAPPPAELPSNDAESYMGSRTVLANNDPLSFMALPAMSCWSIGLEPPPHNGAHTERTALSMPSSVMLPIPVGATSAGGWTTDHEHGGTGFVTVQGLSRKQVGQGAGRQAQSQTGLSALHGARSRSGRHDHGRSGHAAARFHGVGAAAARMGPALHESRYAARRGWRGLADSGRYPARTDAARGQRGGSGVFPGARDGFRCHAGCSRVAGARV